MNSNPSLVLGLAVEHVKKSGVELHPVEQSGQQIELRVYPNNGSGYWFVRGYQAGRWYFMEESGAAHFNRADLAELEAAIGDGARVQLVGYHGRPLATWRTWGEFEEEIK